MSHRVAIKVGDLVYNHETAELGTIIVENPFGIVLELRDGIAVVCWATADLPGHVQIRGKVLRWIVDRFGRRLPVCEETLAPLRALVVREAREDDY